MFTYSRCTVEDIKKKIKKKKKKKEEKKKTHVLTRQIDLLNKTFLTHMFDYYNMSTEFVRDKLTF